MLTTYQQQAKAKLALTVIAIIVVAGIVVIADRIKSGDADEARSTTAQTAPAAATTTTPSTTTATTSTASTAATTSTLKDGTYTASNDYFVPPGTESISVTTTLQNGVITDVSVRNSENDRDSAIFQQEFAANYKSAVVGKKISGLQLHTVAGASDTTQGFNSALSQIASKAQA